MPVAFFVGWPVVAVITEAWPLFVVIVFVVVPRMLCCHPLPSFGFCSRPEGLRKVVYIITVTASVDRVFGRVAPIVVITVVVSWSTQFRTALAFRRIRLSFVICGRFAGVRRSFRQSQVANES